MDKNNKGAQETSTEVLDDEVVRAVFDGNDAVLSKLTKKQLNTKDKHGNTPLMLAVVLEKEDLALQLLSRGADLRKTNTCGWDVLAEAVCLGFSKLIKAIVMADQKQTSEDMTKHKDKLHAMCSEMKDFYLEIEWEFHSWVPLVSRLLPHDVLRIWKRDHVVRVDSELIDIADGGMTKEQLTTLIQIPTSADDKLVMFRLDHEHKVYTKHLALPTDQEPGTEKDADDEADADLKHAVALSTPLVDIDIIARNSAVTHAMTGIFGFGSPRVEAIGDYQCDVYSLSNVQFKSRKRKEHLSPQLKSWHQEMKREFQSGEFDLQALMEKRPPPLETARKRERRRISHKEYSSMDEESFKDWLSSPYQEQTKTKNFTSTLWMSPEFPLTIERIVALLSPFEEHSDVIKTLVKFLQNKLPPGFPVKLDIPVAPTVSARIVFKAFSFDPIAESVTAIPNDYKELHHECPRKCDI
ncbi:hypothetical protein PTSG_04731 [Salpingoeca rosetta]|uniref:Ankyrin repeat domain-containing protein n=1 Tax=Salpingoeca rosetta (strain ATCC 50818 / BSB-021) TaxID=946362 RepID=F2U9J5_SALR5|nr:uncharacterized protein PTSG_04731 [Salpingoeca rosetta]EGD73022.1 hypothetical protein PTSG_04731 [Salpingoeca rosetta]|eukprot:XP_004994053.1 hypothetical protein PTSG_04731 [Salpingoeca rosetta]